MALNTRIKNKRDTAANWETADPVLLEGEIIIVTTNAGDIRFKIGDGTKTYTQLPFQDESLYNVLSGKADAADLESLQDAIDGKQDVFANTTITNDGITSLNGTVKITNDDDTAYMSMTNMGFVVLEDSKILSVMTDSIQFVGVEGSITGLGAPTDDGDATNKEYVDTALSGKADSSHDHSASEITSGTLAVARGGTGYTSIADTTYTTARYRASALYSEASIVDPTTNGVINWAYA